MNTRLRALHLSPIMPARSGNGLAMRQGMFLEALSREFETQLVLLPVAGPRDAPADLPDELGVKTTVVPVAGRQDTHFTLLARLADPGARLAAFRAYGRSSLAAHLGVSVLNDLAHALGGGRYDLVHVGRSYLADALPAVDAVRVSMDLDEDEWTSCREVAATLDGTDPVAADWLRAEADALSALIGRSASRVDRHFISSARDAEWIAARHSGVTPETIENAVALPGFTGRRDDGGTLLFVGSFGYAPNADAARWLVHDILPAVRAQAGRPVRLLLVGRDSALVGELGSHPGVELAGEVSDLAAAYGMATVFAAPLRAGAGTRLKLLEAAAHRVPIVSTTLGARGLAFGNSREILIAEDTDGFVRAILAVLENSEASAARAEAAHAVVASRYDRAAVIDRLACRLRDIAAKPPRD